MPIGKKHSCKLTANDVVCYAATEISNSFAIYKHTNDVFIIIIDVVVVVSFPR